MARALAAEISLRIRGHDEEIDWLSNVLRRRYFFLKRKWPIGVLCLVGPVDADMTNLVEVMTDRIYGSKDNLTLIDMRQFTSEDSGQILFGPDADREKAMALLPSALRKASEQVIVLRHIECAHPSIINTLMSAWNSGSLAVEQNTSGTDEVSTGDALFILTTTSGWASIVERYPAEGLLQDDLGRLARRVFYDEARLPAELSSRIDAILTWHDGSEITVRSRAERRCAGLIVPAGERSVVWNMISHYPDAIRVHVSNLALTDEVPADLLVNSVREATATLVDAGCEVVTFHSKSDAIWANAETEALVLNAIREGGAEKASTTPTALRRALMVLGVQHRVEPVAEGNPAEQGETEDTGVASERYSADLTSWQSLKALGNSLPGITVEADTTIAGIRRVEGRPNSVGVTGDLAVMWDQLRKGGLDLDHGQRKKSPLRLLDFP